MRQRVLLLVLVAVLLAGCGGPSGRRTTRGAVSTPTQAPVVAATTAPPTAAPATATPVPPTVAPSPTPKGIVVTSARSTEITALWYGTDAGGAPTGGASRVRITVEPNTSQQFRVGFFESEVGASGPMWRASGWVATTMAALLTGFDPMKTQVSFDVGGRIDGPSAGGLMTCGVLAALRGDTIREDAAMTGTINPDGTIGPVGGIPYKLEGAAKAGKKLVLIPTGRTEDGVDLLNKGRELGLEVREVTDIYAAYQLLTNKALPRSSSTERPQVSGPIYDRLAAKAKEWQARYQEAAAQYDALPDQLKLDFISQFMQPAQEASERSTRLADQGMAGGAYGQAVEAALWASMAAQTGRILEIYANQGLDGVVKQLGSQAAFDTKVSAMADRLKSEQPKTLSGAGALIEAYASLIEGLGLARTGTAYLQAAEEAEAEEEVIGNLTAASLYIRLADLSLETAKDLLDLAGVLEGAPMPKDAPLANVAEFFRRASEANLALFDTVVLEPLGQRAGMSMAAIQQQFAASDLVYAQARAGLEVMPQVLERYFGQGEASAYAQLGGALAAYSASTGLIAKYYSLGAQLDDNLEVTGFGKERALIDTLDLADEQARGSIAYLKQNEVDPALTVAIYEAARLSREGDVTDKMSALTSYWDVYIQTRALAYLGGFAEP